VIALGGADNHSPYRSELTEFYAILLMVNKFCEFYKFYSGTIEFACNGLSALNKAVFFISIVQVDNPSYDLLWAI
jgi:hypothetical protein